MLTVCRGANPLSHGSFSRQSRGKDRLLFQSRSISSQPVNDFQEVRRSTLFLLRPPAWPVPDLLEIAIGRPRPRGITPRGQSRHRLDGDCRHCLVLMGFASVIEQLKSHFKPHSQARREQCSLLRNMFCRECITFLFVQRARIFE